MHGLGPLSNKQVKEAFDQAHEDTAMNSINDKVDGDELIQRLFQELRVRSPFFQIEELHEQKS